MNILKQVQLCSFVSAGHIGVHEFKLLLLGNHYYYYYYLFFGHSILLLPLVMCSVSTNGERASLSLKLTIGLLECS